MSERNMRFIIMCAGSAERWKNHMGTTKQMVPINGEPMLHRTIRLLKERDENNIIVTVPSINFYGKLPVPQFVGSNEFDIDKVINVKNLIAGGKTILLYGDVIFTEYAIDEIIQSCDGNPPPLFLGRYGMNKYTKKHGELFAIYVNEKTIQKAIELKELHKEELTRMGGWELYRYINNHPLDKHIISEHFIDIHDATDDFDYPEDYDNFVKNGGLDNLK